MAEGAPYRGPNIGIEASGGIRSAPDALAVIAAGATRVGAALVATGRERRQAG